MRLEEVELDSYIAIWMEVKHLLLLYTILQMYIYSTLESLWSMHPAGSANPPMPRQK
jgi:hypothetical protein